MPVSAIILALMAIPLSYVNPRAGRSANMLIAILIYAIYSNMISVSQAWVAQGKLSFWIGVWAAHALMLVPLLLLFYKRVAISTVSYTHLDVYKRQAIACACSATYVGWQMLGGRFPRFFASAMPSAMASPCASASSACGTSLRLSMQKVTFFSGLRASSFLLLN